MRKDGKVAEKVIEVSSLSHSYGEKEALNSVSFAVEEGEFFGVLGPNGAGKTTLIKVLTGVYPPQSGEVRVLGKTPPNLPHESIGVVPQEVSLYEECSPEENLLFFGRVLGVEEKTLRKRVENLLRRLDLVEKRRVPISKLSGGTKRKVNFAVGLVNHPRVLFMDEPTVGMDVEARLSLYEIFRKLKESGITVIFTTHYLEEAERLCDRLLILNEGRAVATGTPAQLVAKYGGGKRVEIRCRSEEWAEKVAERVRGRRKGAEVLAVAEDPAFLLSQLSEFKDYIVEFVVKNPSLETVFLTLTGRRIEEE